MKKFFFLIITLAICAGNVSAQHEVGTFTVQPKAGLNIAYFSDDAGALGVDTKPRLGLVCGIEVEYQLMKKLSLSAGALYSMQGEKTKIAGNYFNSERTVTAKTDYINFPILANFYLFKGFALKVGVQPAVNVKASYTSSDAFGETDGNLSYYGINIRTFDLAIPFGISYEYKNFVLEARYNLGVTNIVKGDDSKNRVAQITIGRKFSL